MPVPALSETIRFDIPAQPLPEAVQAFGAASGLSVLAQSSVLRGHRSTGLHGAYTPRQAIGMLLSGTNLMARFPGGDAVAIYRPAQPAAPRRPAEPRPAPGPYGVDGIDTPQAAVYVGQVQRRVIDALCRNTAARPGAYRMALRFHIAPSGAIAAPRRAGSTGDAARDAVILDILDGLPLDPPPPSLPQPITLLLRPDGAGVPDDCASAIAGGR